MKSGCRCALLVVALGATTNASAAGRVSSKALIKAAQQATLAQIDDGRKQCKDERNVAGWLNDVLADYRTKPRWAGGKCVLVNEQNPIDAGTNWCARAEIAQKDDRKPATIEVFFEKPKGGKPGAPFAFRATMLTADGWDYMRDTFAFEVNWKRKYWKDYEPPSNQDCN